MAKDKKNKDLINKEKNEEVLTNKNKDKKIRRLSQDSKSSLKNI